MSCLHCRNPFFKKGRLQNMKPLLTCIKNDLEIVWLAHAQGGLASAAPHSNTASTSNTSLLASGDTDHSKDVPGQLLDCVLKRISPAHEHCQHAILGNTGAQLGATASVDKVQEAQKVSLIMCLEHRGHLGPAHMDALSCR